MEAKELMIGDKVMVKVLSQIPDTYVLHTWTANDYSRDIQIKPITLTHEILEENEWWFNVEDEWMHFEVNFTIEKFNGRFQCYDINQIKIDSVHELQHALRLCGLNELADNFKVYEE